MLKVGMKHIRVLYDLQKMGGWVKESFQHGKEDIKWLVGIVKSDDILGSFELMLETKKRISNAEESKNPVVKETLELLKATGIIEEWIISNSRILKRFVDWSWRSGAMAIIKAFEAAENGKIQIVTFSGNNYKAQSLDTYREEVKKNPEKVNIWAIPWLIKLQEQWRSQLSLWKETWENISVYCYNKNWNTRIIGGNIEIATFMGKIYGEKKVKEERNLANIINTLLPGIEKDDPRLAELLRKSNLKRNPNGTIDADEAIKNMKITDVNQIPWEFWKIADTLKKEATEIRKIYIDIAKSISIKTLADLKISWMEKWEALDREFTVFSESEIRKYTPIIQDHLKTISDPTQKKNIQNILTVLVSRGKELEIIRLAADAKRKENASRQILAKNPQIKPEQLGKELNSTEEQEKAKYAQDVAVARTQSNDQLDTLKENKIYTIEQAQSKLQELEQKWELTKEEQILRSKLIWYIKAKIDEAQVFKSIEWLLTKEDKEWVFADINRFVSNNPTEQYNFKALERIAIFTDPESSIWARHFAKMEPGQTLSMAEFVVGELRSPISSAPEISGISVSMNSSGSYDIPTLSASNLSKEQVREYMTNVTLYADMWLSQLIPHLTMLTGELRNKWVNTALDGESNTMEQQQVLKALYSQLFGKEVISSSLGDVERAYSSALGNPINMRDAMQYVLKTHHLISESGQSIAPDSLQKWLRENKTENQKPTINLT